MTRKEKIAELTRPYSVTITGRHVHVTDAMKSYAMEKLYKLERLSDRIVEIHVTMDIQRHEQRVDIKMAVSNLIIKSQASTDDMYASIDQAVHKLEKQLKRYKRKIQDHHGRHLSVIDMNVNVIRAPADITEQEANEEIESENGRRFEEEFKKHEVVRRETIPLKTLSTDEAVMKMELSGDAFLIFRDESDRLLKVMYRRKDRNYGIIETETRSQ